MKKRSFRIKEQKCSTFNNYAFWPLISPVLWLQILRYLILHSGEKCVRVMVYDFGYECFRSSVYIRTRLSQLWREVSRQHIGSIRKGLLLWQFTVFPNFNKISNLKQYLKFILKINVPASRRSWTRLSIFFSPWLYLRRRFASRNRRVSTLSQKGKMSFKRVYINENALLFIQFYSDMRITTIVTETETCFTMLFHQMNSAQAVSFSQ
jgi:hypothetical protein